MEHRRSPLLGDIDIVSSSHPMIEPLRASHILEVSQAISVLERVLREASNHDLTTISGELERLRAAAWLRLMTPDPAIPKVVIDTEDHYLTIPEVAKRTRLSLSHVYQLARLGILPVKPMGKSQVGRAARGYRVLLSDLRSW